MGVSVVDQDAPLLLSKTALKALGAVMNLGEGRITLERLGVSVPLRETKSGLCGFFINAGGIGKRSFIPEQNFVQEDLEIVVKTECDLQPV